MKMTDILAERPLLSAGAGFSGLGLSTLEALTPYVQFGIALASLVLVSVTLALKVREWNRGR